MLLSNVQSLLPKIDEINAFASTMKPDILVFCETWLSGVVDDKDIYIPGYCPPIRHDRAHRRGDVCIHFKHDIACNQISIGNCPSSIQKGSLSLPQHPRSRSVCFSKSLCVTIELRHRVHCLRVWRSDKSS